MNFGRRQFLSLAGAGLTSVVAAASVLATGPANAQTDFPNRRIHLVMPYPPGGAADIAARIVTDKLSEIWRQPIVVEAKPAGSGNVAWDEVSRAKPDGYTWTYIVSSTMANPRIFPNLPGARRASCRSEPPCGRHRPWLFIQAFRSIRWRSSSTMSGNVRAFSAWPTSSAPA